MLGVSNYPGQLIFVDMFGNSMPKTCQIIASVLEDTLGVASWLPRHLQPTGIGITALSAHKKIICALQPFSNNFNAVQESLRELTTYFDERGLDHSSLEVFHKLLFDGCLSSTAVKNFPLVAAEWSSLEVTVLTSRDFAGVYREITKVIKECNSRFIKKMRLVHIAEEGAVYSPVEYHYPLGDETDECSKCSYELHFIDYGDRTKLKEIFKELLIGRLTMSEDYTVAIHLTVAEDALPVGPSGCTLKCETQEPLLNPTAMPYSDCFNTDNWSASFSFANHIDRESSAQLPAVLPTTRDLVSVKLLPVESICESAKFGMPLVLKPTCYWKLDWSELSRNQQAITALAQLLRKKGMVLVVRETYKLKECFEIDICGLDGMEKPRGYFAIYPARTADFLVLRSLVCEELSVQRVQATEEEEVDNEVLTSMENVLSKIKTEAALDPEKLVSGLASSLIHLSTVRHGISQKGKSKCPARKNHDQGQRSAAKRCRYTITSKDDGEANSSRSARRGKNGAGSQQKRLRVMEPLDISKRQFPGLSLQDSLFTTQPSTLIAFTFLRVIKICYTWQVVTTFNRLVHFVCGDIQINVSLLDLPVSAL